MIEARQKKAVFLREASRAINLNTRVEACRFEDFAQESHPGFDTVITRAVRVDQGLLATIDRTLATDGRFYYFTSKDAATKHPNSSHFVTTTTDFVNPAGFRVVTHDRTR